MGLTGSRSGPWHDPAAELARVFGPPADGSAFPDAALVWARTTLVDAGLDPEQDRVAAVAALRAAGGLGGRAARLLVNHLAHGW